MSTQRCSLISCSAGWWSAALFALVMLVPIAAASGNIAQEGRRPPAPTPPPATQIRELDTVRPGLAPLLREGSQIQNAVGTLHEDVPSATWRFTIRPEDAGELRYEFIVLPNSHLGEMRKVLETMPDRRVTFQLTGEVFIYEGRNYLLASFPPRVVSNEAPRQADSDDSASNETLAHDGEIASEARSAAEIMRELQREAGPIGRSTAVPRRDREVGAAADQLVPENTTVHLRRGRVSRDGGGAWQFIFDADVSGRADPPMTLMPCLLLERIEQFVRRAGSNAPVLVSGRVFTHAGRNYLLPTVFQIPYERTHLKP